MNCKNLFEVEVVFGLFSRPIYQCPTYHVPFGYIEICGTHPCSHFLMVLTWVVCVSCVRLWTLGERWGCLMKGWVLVRRNFMVSTFGVLLAIFLPCIFQLFPLFTKSSFSVTFRTWHRVRLPPSYSYHTKPDGRAPQKGVEQGCKLPDRPSPSPPSSKWPHCWGHLEPGG